MKIFNIQNLSTKKFSQSTQPNFKSGTIQDTFKRTINTYEMYNKKLEENSEVAFIYNPDMKTIEKIKLLNKKPHFVSASEIGLKINIGQIYWANPRCFKLEYFEKETLNNPNRKYIITLINTLDPLNQKPLEFIQNLPKTAINTDKFAEKLRISKEKLKEYIEKGYIERISLPDLKTGEDVQLNLIDYATPRNRNFIQKYKNGEK